MADPGSRDGRSGGRPRRPRAGSNIALRLLPDLLDPLDRFRAAQGGISRPEAIRMLVRDGLAEADAMPVDPGQQSSLEPDD